MLVGYGLDHLYDIFRFGNQANELLVLRLEQLKQGPDGDVLESWITTLEEAF